jgi:rare lipoprotein A (peptidoglycan hydrolase)
VNGELLERQLALVAVALVSILGGLALSAGSDDVVGTATSPPADSSEAWQEARVGTFGPGLYGTTTTCGIKLRQALQGVAHPVLPCGARLVVELNGRAAETRVVDKGSYGGGQEFALTKALADALGLEGQTTIRWRFSQGAR